MKKIEAIIRPEFLLKIKRKLEEIGHYGMTITEVQGCGKQGGITQNWRGEKYKIEFLQKIKIEMVVKEKDVEKIIDVIVNEARTGEIGDGKIFILPIETAIKIRTGEKGESAI
ncbi:MAG: P-II family nitrogen regulator [bacterium]|nr:P-II family nitrogen regulator [bacterium]MCX7916650.1 P-II family nitrogen regulator [bacterium]MDW8163403.1 P-II family nitrogen regulator [Candidatus Omnitrophota bacterium]